MNSAPLRIPAIALCLLSGLLLGQNCDVEPFSFFEEDGQSDSGSQPSGGSEDSTGSTDDSGSDAGSSGPSGPAINVNFSIKGYVVSSLGYGINGEAIEFTANKYWWDSYEEEWVHRRSHSAQRTTNSGDLDPGYCDPWRLGYNVHEGETVFFEAKLVSTGATYSWKFTYDQARSSGGSAAHTFTLQGGV